MDDRRERPARDNAAWCDLMCRLHGGAPVVDDELWSTPTRAPRFHPDAVTLVSEPSVEDLLARIDDGPGCSVKDSYASLDLAPHGFGVLFRAVWLLAPPGPPGGERRVVGEAVAIPALPAAEAWRWDVVVDAEGLVGWARAWGQTADEPVLFGPGLLDHRAVTVLAARAGEGGSVVAGAVLHRSPDLVGVTNVFGPDGTGPAAHVGALAVARRLHPGLACCGYERGAALDAAVAAGFEPVGPLRVWVRA